MFFLFHFLSIKRCLMHKHASLRNGHQSLSYDKHSNTQGEKSPMERIIMWTGLPVWGRNNFSYQPIRPKPKYLYDKFIEQHVVSLQNSMNLIHNSELCTYHAYAADVYLHIDFGVNGGTQWEWTRCLFSTAIYFVVVVVVVVVEETKRQKNN